MSYEYNNNVSKNEITRKEFEQKLDKKLENLGKKKQAEYKEKAMDIFSHFAKLNGDENTLDEREQIMAKNAFQALDGNQNGKISKKELRKGKKGTNNEKTFAEKGLKASKYFMETFDNAV